MAPERERPTRRQIKEGRAAQQAADRLGREVDRMKERSDEIEQARSDWQRKRADNKVPGAIPLESQEDTREQPSGPAKDHDENAPSDSAEEDGADEDDNNRST
jgi:hypothetical protein